MANSLARETELLKEHLKQVKLQDRFDALHSLGVKCLEDLEDVEDSDLDSPGIEFTAVEKNRFRKLRNSIRTPQSPTATMQQTVSQHKTFRVHFVTVQPDLFAKRELKSICMGDPSTTSFNTLIRDICKQEIPGKLQHMTAQLYRSDGMPLAHNSLTGEFTLSDWRISPDTFYWCLFHSSDIASDCQEKESMEISDAPDPNEGDSEIQITGIKHFSVRVNLSRDSSQILKLKIYRKTKIPPSVMRLMTTISDVHSLERTDAPLADCGLREGSKVQLMIEERKNYSTIESVLNAKTCRPSVPQTSEGMSIMNSSLMCLAEWKIPGETKGYLLSNIYRLCQFPPLLVALKVLVSRKIPCKAHRIALQEGFFLVFKGMLQDLVKSEEVFEYSLECWRHLLESIDDQCKVHEFSLVSLSCPLSHSPLCDPMKHKNAGPEGPSFDRLSLDMGIQQRTINKYLPSGEQDTRREDFQPDESSQLLQAIMSFSPSGNKDFVAWLPAEELNTGNVPQAASPSCLQASATSTTNQSDIFSVLSTEELLEKFDEGDDDRFILTLGAKGNIVVFTELCKGLQTHFLYNPLTGETELHDPKTFPKQRSKPNTQKVKFDKGSVCFTTEKATMSTMETSESGSESLTPSLPKEKNPLVPREAIVVLLDCSSSMKKEVTSGVTRLQLAKELFKTFIDRSRAYEYQHVFGLTTFAHEVNIVIPLQPGKFSALEGAIDDIQTAKKTVLWDALQSAATQLKDIAVSYPKCLKRIICLSDGFDSKSTAKPHEVAKMLQEKEIVLDCVLIGGQIKAAKAVAIATNGCAAFVSTSEEAMSFFQCETILSLHERNVGQRKDPVRDKNDLQRYENDKEYPYCSNPERVKPPELSKSVTDTYRVLRRAATLDSHGFKLQNYRRLLVEIKSYQKNPNPNIEIYPCEDQVNFWKILLSAPESSLYEGGVFLLYASFPKDYPQAPPEVRFVTPIYHCNINNHGKVCHGILKRSYSADTTVRQILDCIYGLLLEPEMEDPLDSAVAEDYHLDQEKYSSRAIGATKQFASKSLKEWRKELIGSPKPIAGEPPPAFLCPLSGDLMRYPVITPYGNTYERAAIEEAIEKNGVDPKANKSLTKDQLFPIEYLQQAIKEFEASMLQFDQ
jgi:ubiquitin-protein ligase/Mg-chelatase subunit ChlD